MRADVSIHFSSKGHFAVPGLKCGSYMLACLNNSKSIVECGTSFGVSTIYMALAVSRNVSGSRTDAYGVFTVEKDGSKVRKAKSIWAEAGSDVEDWVYSYEGDLTEILSNDKLLPPIVDLVFLDGQRPPGLRSLVKLPLKYADSSSVDIPRSSSTEADPAETTRWLLGVR
jgi:hypothetical protein